MLPINLEGDTLGQRYSSLNKITNEAFNNNVSFDEIINLKEESQVDRLFKIDLASKQRNVNYIIENIKSTNSLYFSRALHSTWLFSDKKYDYIVNPQYLYKTLFPQMTNKAICKFVLRLRLNLKDEKRCEDFFTYYSSTGNENLAKKYLPKCSKDFILLQLKDKKIEIDEHMFKLLCEKSLEVIDAVIPKLSEYLQWSYVKAINFIASTEPYLYLHLLDKYWNHWDASIGKRTTDTLVTSCKSKILTETKFCKLMDLSALGKHLSQPEIKELLIKMSRDPENNSWFTLTKITPILKYLRRDEKLEFLKSIFEQRHLNKKPDGPHGYYIMLCSSGGGQKSKSLSASNVYQCYRFAPFKTAFPELKKLIRTESSPDERLAMLKILATVCRHNQSNILSLLQYFHDRHINEPRNFKMKFLRTFLSSTNATLLDEKCWNVLNEIFHNCEVYDENCNDAQICVNTIIAHHILHGTSVPDNLFDKFYKNFSSHAFLVGKLDKENENKILNRICTKLYDQIGKLSFESKNDLKESIELANDFLDFIKVWKKSLSDYPIVIELIKKIIVQSSVINVDDEVINLYNKEKKWRRLFFDETLLIDRSESAYMNVLKHNAATFLPNHHNQLEKVIKSDKLKYKKYFSKIWLYFYNDLALNYQTFFEKKLEVCHKETTGAKSVVFSVCMLTEKDKFSSLIQEYIPQKYKVVWSTEDPCILNLRKNFASYMHLVHPTVDIENVLAFTKGDYLQYAISSLLSVCARKSTDECKKVIPMLLGGAISVQKLGIRLAFLKLPIDEVTKLLVELWDNTSNASIRALIFRLIFELLCKEKNDKKILELWLLMQVYIGKLSAEEDRSVYPVLSQVEKVPVSIRAQFCMVSYKCLKLVPEKFNCNQLLSHLTAEIAKLCKDIDEELVIEIIMEVFQVLFVNKGLIHDVDILHKIATMDLVIYYLLCCDKPEMQHIHFDKVAKPLISHYRNLWNETRDHKYVARAHLTEFLEHFIKKSIKLSIDRQNDYVSPKLIFNMMRAEIEKFAPLEDYFATNVYLTLAYLFHDSLDNAKVLKDNYSDIEDESEYITSLYEDTGKLYGIKCGELIQEYGDQYYFALEHEFLNVLESFLDVCLNMYYNDSGNVLFKYALVISLLEHEPNSKRSVMAFKLLPAPFDYHTDAAKKYYQDIYKKLQSTEDREIQFLMKQRYTESPDFYTAKTND